MSDMKTSELVGANSWIRLVAKGIDLVVWLLAIAVSGPIAGDLPRSIFNALTGETMGWQEFQYSGSVWGNGLSLFILIMLYFVLFEAICGITPGKAICGLRVVRQDGSPCGWMRAIGRSVALVVDGFLFGLVAAVSINRSPLNQRLGDKWFGTVVVSKRDWRINTVLRFLLAALLYVPLALVLSSLVLALDRIVLNLF